uniref:ABC transporter domain-containing protein n=1 Tax=Zea mays TaxID=4577 RepID=A0A804R6B1_MAIZE
MASSLLVCLVFLSAAAAAGAVTPRRSLAAQARSGDIASLAAGSPMVAGLMNERLKALTTSFAQQMGREFHYCIKNMDREWNTAFNFSSDPAFLTACMKETDGDLPQRVCTAAEMKFYFESFLEGNGRKNYVRPNKNCNLTSWIDGCEPGWSCSAGKDQEVNLKDAVNIPSRTLDCRGCCAGFFCPHGLTCMIPCPLGAYCPQSTLNKTTGICDPYHYQPPAGKPNHTCGGADRWADVVSTDDVFCPPGYYCPSTVKKLDCSSGFYCRKGSILKTKCFHKGSCKPNSTNQDITIFGALLVGALSLVLLIIYNFSGQLLMNREKKQAKSREAAVRHARETAVARERWKTAKDIAKKHAAGLQSSLSRTFSRKRSLRTHESSKGGTGAGLPSTSGDQTTTNEAGGKKEDSHTDMARSTEDNPEKGEGVSVQVGGGEKKKTKGKHAHTQSQIFKYAYGQIEKEKMMEQEAQNLTFSGVISMATDEDIKKRPTVEIAFKDLTLTLKGSKKKLLRSVTGKLMAGRVAAVMGPSGAGKTTFLSAIAGKATGCETTGMILINGKTEPIRAYKRIIGFVPQDDIVHGNLTVQENLWFNARCRLSADMLKADKVLVVERVIESLGLQAVRDSLVGTVEQRGISGGQRKRVNVGLEMVMEPSVLILDEPTSGLDSASSLLLLRALRREALEGVNISMVVHQPRMFDDLILLAKGGMTVYHGPVKKVEEYFAGLSIVVPDRVNPPDYYIDILEGIVKPDAKEPVNVKDLPIRWMLHNGYEVPRDMLQSASDSESSLRGERGHASGSDAGQSIAGEVWGNVRDIVGQKKDEYDYNKTSENLSNRRTPGILRQYKYYLGSGFERLEYKVLTISYLALPVYVWAHSLK